MALRNATLMFLVKKDGGSVREICLAMKKRGFGVGRWNGSGGKQEAGESVEAAAIRETREEIGVEVSAPAKVAEIDFFFPHKPEWDQRVHVYLAESWRGEPAESEEMRPAWHALGAIPYPSMWPDDSFWLPLVLAGKKVRASFTFAPGDLILQKQIQEVAEL